MTNGSARVTVVIAAYNAAEFLGRCLDSLENQTFLDLDVVVVIETLSTLPSLTPTTPGCQIGSRVSAMQPIPIGKWRFYFKRNRR